jgi:aerobic-type carbon monoxide dehydrogenase small subunit (CoxS/CutS family)
MTFHLNGARTTIDPPEGTTLLELLRDFLHLTGTKYGCGEGVCGACTVLLEGRPVRACLTPASTIANKHITTIEGLAAPDHLHPLQQAFLDVEAFQCGFCTPGMIVAAAALLQQKPHPTERDIQQALEGHLCRCGTYPRIVEAVLLAAKGAQHA